MVSELSQFVCFYFYAASSYKPGTSSSSSCLQRMLINASHNPLPNFPPLWCSKASWCDLPDLTSAWGRGAGARDANVCGIYVQISSYKMCVLVPCLALLSDSYYLCCLGPNFQFNTWLPWRTPTWSNINGEVAVGFQWGGHSACSATHPTWGHL